MYSEPKGPEGYPAFFVSAESGKQIMKPDIAHAMIKDMTRFVIFIYSALIFTACALSSKPAAAQDEMLLLPDSYLEYNAPNRRTPGNEDFSLGGAPDDEQSASEIFSLLPDDIKQEIIDEAAQVQRLCERNSREAMFYDCECIASRFIDGRVIRGPDIAQSSITSEIKPDCVNVAGVAGYAYRQCNSMRAYGASRPEEVCNCYGNYVAYKFQAAPIATFSFFNNYSTEAIISCKKDSNAHQRL